MTVRGIDLSQAMVELARREHPEVSFEVGEMGALDVADASLAGLVARYPVIHVPASQRREVISEFHRVLPRASSSPGSPARYLQALVGNPGGLLMYPAMPRMCDMTAIYGPHVTQAWIIASGGQGRGRVVAGRGFPGTSWPMRS